MDRDVIGEIVRRALREDLPDVTTNSIFEGEAHGYGSIIAREEGILAGLPFATAVFEALDPDIEVTRHISDGEPIAPGDVIAEVSGLIRALLSGERTALNLMQRASGIATATRRFVDAVEGTGSRIYDTRKTAPGLRVLDKYAVRTGGGTNHRFSLHDMVLIKNNHIDHAGGVEVAIDRVRDAEVDVPIMVEARNLDELDAAIARDPDFVLLDNMTVETMRRAVEQVNRSGRSVVLEASGGITLANVRSIADTGVSRISIGALTHSSPALDLSMRVEVRSGT